MAASTGGEDIQEASSVENAPRPPITTQQNVDKVEDVSANGTVSCSSFVGVNKNSSVLRPSGFTSSNASNASGKSIPVFGTSVSSSHFGSVSLQTFGVSPQKNPFSLRRSVFGSNQDSDSGAKKPVVLKASQLEPQTGSAVSSTTHNANCSFVLSPAKLNNPFFKAVGESEDTSSSTITSSTSIAGHSVNCHETLSEKGNSLKSDVPKVSFVPLASSSGSSNQGNSQTPAPTTGTTTVPTFVFGQNLHERVEVSAEAVRSEVESSDVTTSDAVTHHEEASKTNGVTPEMLFSSVIQRELPDKQSEVGSDEKKQKSLSEAAREYEESRAVKRKYEEVTVKTGEEEEMNVLQINCKLFAFNKDKSTWVERGRGTLRLNDLSTDNRTQSRVVMRVSGSLRVVLNTKIWAEMVVDRPSDKSLRLTAMDGSGEIKVFLVMAGVKEIDQLFKALEWRVNNQKKLATACDKSSENNET